MVQEVLDEMGVTMDGLDDSADERYALLVKFNDEVNARDGALAGTAEKAAALAK